MNKLGPKNLPLPWLMSFESQEHEQTTVKPPTEFKAGSKWRPFKKGTIAYFNSIFGRHNIPLA
jgi:hypothetical protein